MASHQTKDPTMDDGKIILLKAGTYGTVYKRGSDAAVKVYSRGNVEDGTPYDAIREIAILKALHHRNIVRMLGVEFIEKLGHHALVLELAEYGSLQKVLDIRFDHKMYNNWSTSIIMGLLIDMWAGLKYMHESGVVHRDIKPDNMLLFGTPEGKVVLKIADFGTSLVHLGKFDEGRTDPITTLWYRAPEVAFGLDLIHGPAMDIWSAGLVMREIISGETALFYTVSTNEALKESICKFFGTPTRTNNMMPSYYASKPQHCKAPYPVHFSYIEPAARVYGDIIPGEPFRTMTNMALAMDPTRRCSASWMLKRALMSASYELPIERAGSSMASKTGILDRMMRTPDMAPGYQNVRANMGMCLFYVCTRMVSDSSRRAFHAAAAILDRLVSDPNFITQQSISNREMIKTCMGINMVASKLCETWCFTPESLVISQRADESGFFPCVSPQFTMEELASSERAILEKCGWDILHVTPIDVCVSMLDTSSAKATYLRDYIVDVICCNIGSGGYTPQEVDLVAHHVSSMMMMVYDRPAATPGPTVPDSATVAMDSLVEAAESMEGTDKDEPLQLLDTITSWHVQLAEPLKALMFKCLEEIPKVYGTRLHSYYSAVKRHSVSTIYTHTPVHSTL